MAGNINVPRVQDPIVQRALDSIVNHLKSKFGDTTMIVTGTGLPEGRVSAPKGTIYLNLNGGSDITLWIKESGVGKEGWGNPSDAVISDHSLLSNLTYGSSGHTGFQPALGYTPENVANKSTDTSLGNSDTLYPSQKAVKTYVDNNTGLTGTNQRLGVAAIAAVDTNEALYTVPAATYIRNPKLYITNTNGGLTAKVRVAHVDGAIGALANEDYVLYDDYFLPNETKIIELDGMIATDTIVIRSSQLLVNFDLTGEVLTVDVNMKRVDAIDIDGTTNVVNTDYVAWLTTRACKVNVIVCNRNGGDVAEVQVAYVDSNVIGGITAKDRKYFTLDVNQSLFLELDMNIANDKVISFRSSLANVNCLVYTVA